VVGMGDKAAFGRSFCLAVRRRYTSSGPHERDLTLPHQAFPHNLKSRLGIDGSD
jgi:hypothetical protein